MFVLIKDLIRLLEAEQRKRLFVLQLLVVLMSVAEIVSIAAMGPFMAVIGDPAAIARSHALSSLYVVFGSESNEHFLFVLGVIVLIMLISAGVFSMFTTWCLLSYSHRVGGEVSGRLYGYYLSQSWLFHSQRSSSELIKQIAQESTRVTDGIIQPLMQLNAKLILTLLMVAAIFSFNPSVAVVGVLIFVGAYYGIYRVVRNKLLRNGQLLSSTQAERYQLMVEGFGGVRDIILLGRGRYFVDRFKTASRDAAKSQSSTQVFLQIPRYTMELVAFGGVMLLVLYLMKVHKGDLGSVLPVLAVYALAGFKLLPAFQQIYGAVTTIRSNIPAFQAIQRDLEGSKSARDNDSGGGAVQFPLDHELKLSDVTFSYPGKDSPALRRLELTIPAKKVIGLVGPSGSGKSTIIDLILGLIEPQEGSITVDGQRLDNQNLRAWQDSVGYVPQSIFLADDSIQRNIAFGLPESEIDVDKVVAAAKMAHLNEFVQAMPQGYSTFVGERGVQLSGGQRQRIGIARALYHDANVLILDEATSALDNVTEKLVMDAIHDFSGKKTILMIAHRLSTIKHCDKIFLISDGGVVDSGTYDELRESNELFQRMASHH